MGASSSKPSSGSAPPHVWKASSPASVSQDLVESLQTSSENDTTRSQTAELQIQARVAAELRKLQAAEDTKLRELTDRLASENMPETTSTTSRQAVSAEIDALRARLEARRLVRDVPETVDAARSDVVRCLRDNDRRPLDCWREVERFKEEVRRLEKGWVERVIS